jgi:protein-disulfide isomerase
VPPLTLHDLEGEKVTLGKLSLGETLLLFWNPACGFCQRMLKDLKAWEGASLPGAPRLLVISAGSVDENRGLGLRSRVLIDADFSAGSALGANGTPTAVFLDAQGRIASEVAVGAEAVFALAGRNTALAKDPPPRIGERASAGG